MQAHGDVQLPPQSYDYGYQLYQEDSDRIRIESHYVRGDIAFSDQTSFHFQWLRDAISGSSPTGALPGGVQPFYSNLEDVRTGLLGALSRQFGDHRVEIEISRSIEDDYLSHGYALSDTWDLNQKNTTLNYGINYLDDTVEVPVLGDRKKHGYELFTGVSQIVDKDTLVSANLTIGYSDGYLNDPYKDIQRTDHVTIPDGEGGTIDIPIVNLYRENRPNSRFRQVLQLEGRHFFSPVNGALDTTVRLSHDDYGVFSQTVQIEWRQSFGEHFETTPFFRYYNQNEAKFFMNSLDGHVTGTPANDPQGSGINYSSDYRLSSFNAISGGLRMTYHFTDAYAANFSYERYVMTGSGDRNDRSPEAAYPSANIWTIGVHASF
jgi:hypothetical protein